MTDYIKTNKIRSILKGAVTELLVKQPKNARTFLGQWIGQAQQVDTTRLVLVSSDTPDRADFLRMVKGVKAVYDFETQTTGELVAIIRALVAAHGKFKSIALASHGPASAESTTWAISSKAVVDLADQKSEGFKVLEALAEAVQTGGRVDLLACNLIASQLAFGKSFLKDLEDRTGCNFAASVDKTGNPKDDTTDWIMESNNMDIRDVYFTDTALFDGSFESPWDPYVATLLRSGDVSGGFIGSFPGGVKWSARNLDLQGDEAATLAKRFSNPGTGEKLVAGGVEYICTNDNDYLQGRKGLTGICVTKTKSKNKAIIVCLYAEGMSGGGCMNAAMDMATTLSQHQQ